MNFKLSVPEVKLKNPTIGVPTDVLNNFTRLDKKNLTNNKKQFYFLAKKNNKNNFIFTENV